MNFYNRVMRIRAAAAGMFDKGLALGTPKEKIAEAIQPIQKQFHDLLLYTVTENPKDAIMAMKAFEGNAGAHMENSRWFKKKALEELRYAKDIRKAIFNHMKEKGLSHFSVDGFLVTFSADGLDVELR